MTIRAKIYWLKKLCTEEDGSITTVSAIAAPFLVASLGLAADVGTWYSDKSDLRFQVDGSALTAANLYNRGLTAAELEPIVRSELIAQGLPASTLLINYQYPTSTSDLLTLTANFESNKYFSQLLFQSAVSVSATSVVDNRNYEACVLSLNGTASGALTASGSAGVILNGCVSASNSTADDAILLGGSSSFQTDCMITSGGISGETKSTTLCANNLKNARPTPDPYASLVQPAHTSSACVKAGQFKPNKRYTLSPGCFSGSMSLKGNVSLTAGVYILYGVDLKINSNANIVGSDVTFVMKNGSTIDFNGTASIDLKAPEQGSSYPYPGMLFWADSGIGVTHKISGNSSSTFQGAFYFPSDEIIMTGNAGVDIECTRIVADTVTFKGSASFSSNCDTQLADKDFSATGSVTIVQ